MTMASIEPPRVRQYLTSGSWLVFGRFARSAMGFVVGLLVVRHLGPVHFGELSLATSTVALAAIVAGLGLHSTVVRELVLRHDDRATILGSAATLRLASGLLAAALALVALSFVDPTNLERIMTLIVATTLIFQTSEVIEFAFHAEVRSKPIVLTELVQSCVAIAARVAFIVLDAGVIWFAVLLAFDSLVLLIGLITVHGVVKHEDTPPIMAWRYSRLEATALIQKSWPLILSGFAMALYMRIDQLMIKKMLGTEALGQYSGAVAIAESWFFLAVAITTTVYPALLQAQQRHEAAFLLLMERFYSGMLWLSLSIGLLIWVTADQIVLAALGADFADAMPVLRVYAWAGVAVFLITASSRWYLARATERSLFWRAVAGAILNVVLNLVLIPRNGIVGAAWATVVSYYVMATAYDLVDPAGRGSFALKCRAVVTPLRFFCGRRHAKG